MTLSNQQEREVLMLLPSLRISGGVNEAIKLANDLSQRGIPIRILVLWRNLHELPCGAVPVSYLSSFAARRSTAAWEFPLLLVRFRRFLRQNYSGNYPRVPTLFLTHFSTFPFAWIAPRLDWYCFNQDVEWMFVKHRWGRACLRWFILATCRRSRVITTNAYVEDLYLREGIRPMARLSIWASSNWLTGSLLAPRKTDVVMLLRRGHMKRLDLYFDLLGLMKASGLSSVLVTPDSEIFEQVSKLGEQTVLRPSDEDLKGIYQRSKMFLLLSDTEGFALPPLEAMGSGCVPLCRDSGGPRGYMTGPLASNLIPLDAATAEIFSAVQRLLSNPEELSTLSAYAMECFSTGAAHSLQKRNECIAALTEALQEGD